MLPDGRLSADTTIRLWDVMTGAETARFRRHSNWVTALCVRPDGRLASTSHDKTIWLWDVTTPREVIRLEVDTFVECLVTLADSYLVVGDSLGRLHWLDVVD